MSIFFKFVTMSPFLKITVNPLNIIKKRLLLLKLDGFIESPQFI